MTIALVIALILSDLFTFLASASIFRVKKL